TRCSTCDGSWQLRLNRMKPIGSDAAKNFRSASVNRSPAQPKMAARGMLRLGKDARGSALLQRVAHLRRRTLRHRPGHNAEIGAAVAEIDLHHRKIHRA